MEIKIKSKRSLESDPQYFGVFANMARHNVFKIFHEISERTKLPLPPNEGGLSSCPVMKALDPSISYDELRNSGMPEINRPDKCMHIISLLNHYFRFLPLLNQTLDAGNPDPGQYHKIMCLFLDQLDAVRNQYTHAISKRVSFNDELITKLEFIFDGGLPAIKERFQMDENMMNHLRRYKGLNKKGDKPKDNHAFKYAFYKNHGISEDGLAFFICLFLEPEYSYLFLKRLKDFKEGSNQILKSTLEAYTISRCKLPENKLQSTGDDKTALLLDMLNELQRCPKELFDKLSPQDQKKFQTTSDENEEEESEEGIQALLIRKKNRFPYFALRYIDHTNMFKKLRFQIDIGNYCYHSYDANMDDQKILRRWEKKLLTFGRLHEIGEKAKQKWKTLIRDPAKINDATPAPFIVQTQAHYHFTGGEGKLIGLKDSSEDGFVELPELESGEHAHVKTQEVDYYLSTDELPGLLLYNYFIELYKGRAAEEVIISFKKRVNNFFDEFIKGKIVPIKERKITCHRSAATIAEYLEKEKFDHEYEIRKNWLMEQLSPFGLAPGQVPESLAKYLMGIEPVDITERSEQIVKFQIEETHKLLKRAGGPGSHETKVNKKLMRHHNRNLHLSAGDSALYLAKDMLYLQPHLTDEKGNATGKANPDEFQLLQARLAFFGAVKHKLENTFRLCNLIESGNPHPFLYRINWMKCEGCLEFYKSYLEERISFFESLLRKKSYSDYYFLTGNYSKKDNEYFISLAKKIKDKPVNLPRGLFKNELTILLRQKGKPAIEQLVKGDKMKHNTVFLTNEWYHQISDSYQPFYDFRRNYRTVDEWYDKRSKNSTSQIKKLLRTSEELAQLAEEIKISKRRRKKQHPDDNDKEFYSVYKKKVIENEKLIRHYRTSDQILFLMCKGLLTKENSEIKEAFNKDFFLKDISPENPNSILEIRIPFELPLKTANDQIKKIREKFKVKDYGKFRKYLKDQRLKNLLSFFEKDTIMLTELKEQLRKYEAYRLILFDDIFEFEKTCEKHPAFKSTIDDELNKVDEEGMPMSYVSHSGILNRYKDLYGLAKDESDLLKAVRNAFSHNSFPEKKDIQIALKDERPIIEQVMKYALACYKSCTDKLK